MDGIGPKEDRPKMINSNWGGTVEDNSFGTHEFFNLCELLDCEPYLSGNVGSGSVEELAKWVEYITAEGGTLAELRARNGRKEPWKLKYLGVGNESWGCGGNMRPEYYSDLYRRYATYCRNYDGNVLYKVASGATDYDYNWTKVLMDRIGEQMHGVSLHYYTVTGWTGSKGSATEFDADSWYDMIAKAVGVEEVIENHKSIMKAYDPDFKVDLLLDEWGTWFDVEPGTNPGHLYQQNTMRDAMIAAMSLNIFHRHTDRLAMANIAQIVNVLQSMILTKGREIVLTPTYHVFRMYNVHQDAQFVPTDCDVADMIAPSGRIMPELSVTASKDSEGKLHVSIANPMIGKDQTVVLNFDELKPKTVTGEILSAPSINSYNDFGKEPAVVPKAFDAFKKSGKSLTVTVPSSSVVCLEF
jgi:alpha-N-arabinofuranosidase